MITHTRRWSLRIHIFFPEERIKEINQERQRDTHIYILILPSMVSYHTDAVENGTAPQKMFYKKREKQGHSGHEKVSRHNI